MFLDLPWGGGLNRVKALIHIHASFWCVDIHGENFQARSSGTRLVHVPPSTSLFFVVQKETTEISNMFVVQVAQSQSTPGRIRFVRS